MSDDVPVSVTTTKNRIAWGSNVLRKGETKELPRVVAERMIPAGAEVVAPKETPAPAPAPAPAPRPAKSARP